MEICRTGGWNAWGLLVLGLVFFAGCEKPQPLPPPPPPAVTVSQPLDREVMEWDEYPGRLEATQTVELRARVSGYVDSVSFNEGGIVEKGDLLFVIDARPYQAELDRVQGEVARANARLALAETEFKRTSSLIPSDAASGLELEEKRAGLAEAKAALSVAAAGVESARLNVEFTQVRAPITGRISRIYVTPGNLITGGQAQATLLTVITSLDPIYCYVDADERSVLKYQKLAREEKRVSARDSHIPAKLALLNEDSFEHIGVIDFVDNRVDPTTGTLRARGVFANPNGVMTPGLFGRLRVPGAAPYRALLVSQAAIQSDQDQHHVLTVDADNVVHVTPVKLGASFGKLRAIRGLTGDELVIVNGLLRARPGTTVQPTTAPMPGADDTATLATTRVVGGPATAPTTRPAETGPTTLPADKTDPAALPADATLPADKTDPAALPADATLPAEGTDPVALPADANRPAGAARSAAGEVGR